MISFHVFTSQLMFVLTCPLLNTPLFISPSLCYGRISCFQVLAIMNKCVINIPMQVLWGHSFQTFKECFNCWIIQTHLILEATAKAFSNVSGSFCNLTINQSRLLFLRSIAIVCCSYACYFHPLKVVP